MKSKKFEPLTRDEHVAIGAELKTIREYLLRLIIRACRGYGVSAKVVKQADRATISVDKLCCELDNILCKSLPANDESWRGVYYGDSEH